MAEVFESSPNDGLFFLKNVPFPLVRRFADDLERVIRLSAADVFAMARDWNSRGISPRFRRLNGGLMLEARLEGGERRVAAVPGR
jgi:hypothetical protein